VQKAPASDFGFVETELVEQGDRQGLWAMIRNWRHVSPTRLKAAHRVSGLVSGVAAHV